MEWADSVSRQRSDTDGRTCSGVIATAPSAAPSPSPPPAVGGVWRLPGPADASSRVWKGPFSFSFRESRREKEEAARFGGGGTSSGFTDGGGRYAYIQEFETRYAASEHTQGPFVAGITDEDSLLAEQRQNRAEDVQEARLRSLRAEAVTAFRDPAMWSNLFLRKSQN